jgi:hypothetical protein
MSWHAFTDRITNIDEWFTDEWAALNSDRVYVGNDWKKLYGKKRPPGFATAYGTHSFREDIATVAELMYSDPDGTAALMEEDETLARKVDYLRKWYKYLSEEAEQKETGRP